MVFLALDVTGRELRYGSAGEWMQAGGGRLIVTLIGKLLPYMLWFLIFGLLILAAMLRLLGIAFDGSVGVWALGWLGLVLASFGLGVFLLGLSGTCVWRPAWPACWSARPSRTPA